MSRRRADQLVAGDPAGYDVTIRHSVRMTKRRPVACPEPHAHRHRAHAEVEAEGTFQGVVEHGALLALCCGLRLGQRSTAAATCARLSRCHCACGYPAAHSMYAGKASSDGMALSRAPGDFAEGDEGASHLPHISSCRFMAFSASLRVLSLLIAMILLRSGLSGSAIVTICRLQGHAEPQLLRIGISC